MTLKHRFFTFFEEIFDINPDLEPLLTISVIAELGEA